MCGVGGGRVGLWTLELHACTSSVPAVREVTVVRARTGTAAVRAWCPRAGVQGGLGARGPSVYAPACFPPENGAHVVVSGVCPTGTGEEQEPGQTR